VEFRFSSARSAKNNFGVAENRSISGFPGFISRRLPRFLERLAVHFFVALVGLFHRLLLENRVYVPDRPPVIACKSLNYLADFSLNYLAVSQPNSLNYLSVFKMHTPLVLDGAS
jgi:hypothetical protein